MKFIVDAMLPRKLVVLLRDHGHEARHVRSLGLSSTLDDSIWELAGRANEILISRDGDFVAMAQKNDGTKLVLYRSGNTTLLRVLDDFQNALPTIAAFATSDKNILEVR